MNRLKGFLVWAACVLLFVSYPLQSYAAALSNEVPDVTDKPEDEGVSEGLNESNNLLNEDKMSSEEIDDAISSNDEPKLDMKDPTTEVKPDSSIKDVTEEKIGGKSNETKDSFNSPKAIQQSTSKLGSSKTLSMSVTAQSNQNDKLIENLNRLGFSVSGDISQAIRKFQEYYGVTEDEPGVAGSATLNKINEILSTPLQKGKSHSKTVQLKKDLARLGFPVPGNGTEYFGDDTEKKVKEFQKYYGLVVNGIADEVTLKKIEDLLTGPMFDGLKRDDVIQFKVDLAKLGFPVSNTPTNYYGPTTAAKVKEFQKYYGVIGDEPGVAGTATQSKVQEILSSPLQNGKTHPDTIQLKIDLGILGYTVPGNQTAYYGPNTEAVVKKFQKGNGLVVNGIADEVTLRTIQSLLEISRLKVEKVHLNITLDEALKMQMNASPQTDKYRNEPAFVQSKDVNLYDGGYISENGVNVRTSPKLTSDTVYKTLSYGTSFYVLDSNVKGDMYNGSSVWYKILYDGKTLYVHSALAKINAKIAVPKYKINIYASKNTNSHVYATATANSNLTVLKQDDNWYQVQLGTWRNATAEDVKEYLDPKNFILDEVMRFQFLDLAKVSGASEKLLDDFLANKGVLKGMGKTFIEAGKKYGINELYLISHALLETGNGTSELAKGIKYNGVTVYNMFGIGATDANPIQNGAKMAYEMGWTSVEKAIIGGAAFIGNDYIKAGQSTLYEMRWNTASMNKNKYASHQYATDVGWAAKQVYNLAKLYNEIGVNTLNLKIPVYKE